MHCSTADKGNCNPFVVLLWNLHLCVYELFQSLYWLRWVKEIRSVLKFTIIKYPCIQNRCTWIINSSSLFSFKQSSLFWFSVSSTYAVFDQEDGWNIPFLPYSLLSMPPVASRIALSWCILELLSTSNSSCSNIYLTEWATRNLPSVVMQWVICLFNMS